MAVPTEEQIEAVRDWVGSGADGDAVAAAIVRAGGDVDVAALSMLRRAYTDMVRGDPASWAVAGDWSQSTAVNIAAAEKLIGLLEQRTGDVSLPTVTAARLVRPGFNR